MEIDTETLTEEAYKVDEFAGKVTLLVEAQVSPPCILLCIMPANDARHTLWSW